MPAAVTFAGTWLWIDVPLVKQSREGCGAASLAMVMQYWERQKSSATTDASDAGHILAVLHSPEGHGIYASAMERYLQEHGYQTFAFEGTWNDILNNIAKGRPLIVALEPGRSTALHYVVVAGADPDRPAVMFNDPAGRKLEKLDRKTFEKEWAATKHWTLLALPRSDER